MRELLPPPTKIPFGRFLVDKLLGKIFKSNPEWNTWIFNLYEHIINMNQDPWIIHAVAVIAAEFGDKVSIEAKNKDLLKFGRNGAIGTSSATIMTLPSGELNETYVASDLINSINSDDAADTEEVTIEGHTLSGTDFTFVTQTATLTGTTVVALGTSLARVSRVFNNNSTDLVGNIYVTETDTYTAGVPDTGAKVHLTVAAGENQSEKASVTISDTDYWIVTGFYGDILKKQAAFASVDFEIREVGKVFRHRISLGISGGHSFHPFEPYFIVPKNADVRLVAVADGANTDISGGIQGVLAKII